MVSLKISEEIKNKVIKDYENERIDNPGDYIIFFASFNHNTITIYESKKGYTLFINGPQALKLAKEYDSTATLITPKYHEKEEWVCFLDQIGSDEVGVGDLCLPMIVVAAYVKRDDIIQLINLGIHDSKKLTDEFILKIGPSLVERFEYSKLTLSNEKYNEMISRGENLNSLKARMHNQALINLKKKHIEVDNIFIDQFVNESTYYKYLAKDKDVLKGVTFKTKGESSFPCVALASVIARFAFLKEKENLEKKYEMEIPFGANKKADDFIRLFINKFGLDEARKLVKSNFKNVEDLF